MYDYIIVGSGPSSLTLSYILAKTGKKCLILEKNSTIGGCHRVARVDGLFSEHSPRIYSTAYINLSMLLKDMKIEFSDIFTDYNFTITNIGQKAVSNLGWREIFFFGLSFMGLVINPKHGTNTSMKDYAETRCFSQSAKNYIDALCRFTEGAGSDRYSLHKFLSLLNDQFHYKLQQPKLPNDVGLLKYWREALERTGNVVIRTDSAVNRIDAHTVEYITGDGKTQIEQTDKIILAIPPSAMIPILENSPTVQDTFAPLDDLKSWTTRTQYNQYFSLTFHWASKLSLPKIWGFAQTEWGIVWIEQSLYTKFDDPRSLTVFSLSASVMDRKSSITGKTVNESTEEEIIKEVFRQFILNFDVKIPPPDTTVVYPGMYKKDGLWINSGGAFVDSPCSGTLTFSGTIPSIYNLGTQNGYSWYNFTSMESAVINGMALAHKLDPSTRDSFKIQNGSTLTRTVRILLIFLILIVILIYLYKHRRQ